MSASVLAAARLAILHDMSEEGWPSMDQMGHLLVNRIPVYAPRFEVRAVRHPLVRVASRGAFGRFDPAFSADRIFNRMVLYPHRVRRQVSGRFDIYHVVDHSYAQLALELPAHATIVSCHDIDTFRSLVQAREEPRALLFRAMTRRILAGLRRAALVVCGSQAACDDLVRFDLVDSSRLRVVPNGINPELLGRPSESAAQRAAALLEPERGVLDLLHVGNDVPRKRLDVVIGIVATLQKRGHRVRLVRVGSRFRPATRERARELAVHRIVELPFLDTDLLRAVYARCDLLLLPSDREGYGLPVIEAFAAGKPVVASDIPALRETSAGHATLVAPGALQEWVQAVERVLATPDPDGQHAAARRAYAAGRTWDDHVRGLVPLYAELQERGRGAS